MRDADYEHAGDKQIGREYLGSSQRQGIAEKRERQDDWSSQRSESQEESPLPEEPRERGGKGDRDGEENDKRRATRKRARQGEVDGGCCQSCGPEPPRSATMEG